MSLEGFIFLKAKNHDFWEPRTNCTAVRCHSCLHRSRRLAEKMGGGGDSLRVTLETGYLYVLSSCIAM